MYLHFLPVTTCDVSSPSATGCETISSVEQPLVFEKQGLYDSAIRQLGGGAIQFSINAGTPSVNVGWIGLGLFVGDD